MQLKILSPFHARNRKNYAFLFFALYSLTTGFSQQKNQVSDLEQKVDAYVEPYLDSEAWSGVISISKKGKPIFQKAYGEADREWHIKNTLDTKFKIASISKVFTAVAILKLVEADKLELTNLLAEYLPDYDKGTEITVNHLLNHTSGIPHINQFSNYDSLTKFSHNLEEIIALFKDRPLDFPPGSKYSYSNAGYVLLAYIIEKVSGQSYEQFLQKEIFDPNKLYNTGIDRHSKILDKRAKGYMFGMDGKLMNAEYVNMSIKIGGGSIYSNLPDLEHFMHQLLSRKILKQTLDQLPFFSEKDGEHFFVTQGRVQGFCHRIVHRKNEELTITVLGNNFTNIALPISDDLYKMYSNQDYSIPKDHLSQAKELPIEELKKYEGTFDFKFGPLRKLKVVDGNLTYESLGTDRADVLIPIGEDTFFYTRYWVLVRFKKEQSANYNRLEWIMGDNTWTAQKIASKN